MKVVLSGGGTGGHIYPAIAIADKIKKEHPEAQILFIGTKNGLESQLVPKAGYEIKTITVQGFQRKISIENIKRLGKLVLGLKDAKKILKEFKPDLVIGTGGYVCGPVIWNGAVMGIKSIIHEQNAFPGITNKILGKKVDRILTSFREADKYFENPSKIVLTGNPVRPEIYSISREEARRKLNIRNDEKYILSVGGSGGSAKINKSFLDMMPILEKKNIRYLHVTGKNHYDAFLEKLGENLYEKGQIRSYLDEVALHLAACDLIICSAGAITLAEVASCGRASIVIPKAYTAENHQEYNAKTIEEAGAGYAVLEKDLSAEVLLEKINEIFENSKQEEMELKSKQLSSEKALDKIYQEIKNIMKI